METNPPKEWWDEKYTLTPEQIASALQKLLPLPVTNRFVMDLIDELTTLPEPVPA